MAFHVMQKEGYKLYRNEGGKEIAVDSALVIQKDGFAFRDLEGNGELLPYEDWRLGDEERARDLAGRLNPEEMLGLMLHSSSQPRPAMPGTMMEVGTYGGKVFPECQGVAPWELTDQQKDMLENRGMRHMLVSSHRDVETAVKWTNLLQAYAEALPHGIPVNVSSDPRHGSGGAEVEFRTAASDVSKWPEGIGMAAVDDLELCREFARITAKEYRALGITTALGPQIDLATDPRWFRGRDTFGANKSLSTAMAQSYCDGLQTTPDSETGWGRESVIAMAKHWPGGGTGEGGRDAHYPFGKYAVYPGGRLEEHISVFTEGAMKLRGKTKSCAAMMPYYNIPWNQDPKNHENVGNSYSEYIIKDLLIEKYGYTGVICTDWAITPDKTPHVGMYVLGGKCHGVEHLSEPERMLKLILNGVNQFGGLDTRENADKAYALGCERYGESVMMEKLRLSAYKLLLNMFRVGLFDNPYVDLEESLRTVGCQDFVEKGREAQRKSVVLLKNHDNALPLQAKIKVYVPNRHLEERYNFVRFMSPAEDVTPVSAETLSAYFQPVESPEKADAALLFIESPVDCGGFESKDCETGENGYRPISLQYRPYKAVHARKVSIAGGDPRESSANRSYYDKDSITANESDLNLVIQARERMKDKPVIVCIRMNNPAVLAELEPYADAILVDFGVQKSVLLDAVTGSFSPSGHLPVILPKDMETVETHCEDVATDIEPYQDRDGHVYGFGYGLGYDA